MSDTRHAMAEQDAAILDYLDGLLRESDVVNANVANLTLISSTAAASASAPDDDPSDWSLAEADELEPPIEPVTAATDSEAGHESFDEDVMEQAESVAEAQADMAMLAEQEALSPTMPTEVESGAVEDMPGGAATAETDEASEVALDMPQESDMVSDLDMDAMPAAAMPTGTAGSVDTAYLTLRVGSIKLAFPREEVAAILRDAEIESLRGAPEQVAGVVMHDGKRRMVLSLAPVVIGHAAVPQMQTVLMLGDGLWGVAGGEVVEDMVVDVDQVKWRSPMERHDVRPWLAGLSRANGIAIVDTAALRRALSGTS